MTFTQDSMSAVAHVRDSDKAIQTLSQHLNGVSRLAEQYATKMGLGMLGRLLGLFHDIGKASDAFQQYIHTGAGLVEQDADLHVDAPRARGTIDHSTAGAQMVHELIGGDHGSLPIHAELLSLCLASHHSGLIDCLAPDGSDHLQTRIDKDPVRTSFVEVKDKIPPEVMARISSTLEDSTLELQLSKLAQEIGDRISKTVPLEGRTDMCCFQLGMIAKFLFSCLIDADRSDSASFCEPRNLKARDGREPVDWGLLLLRLETKLSDFTEGGYVNRLRKEISENCAAAAERHPGIFTLTVPTGGGKTLASLRFALRHAQKHGLERIVYVIPYTSIIDQNADTVRKILDPADLDGIVLEHHSNLTPERENWKQKILAENWDAPIVFTTSVQFLEAIFGKGTRGARRLHQLTRAVIIFDEIQTLPIRTIHLFNNAVSFLAENGKSSIVLCTATQPLLDQVTPTNGRLTFGDETEMMPDATRLFTKLRRVEVIDKTKPGGWHIGDAAHLACKEMEEQGSVLCIVNTKAVARELYKQIVDLTDVKAYHLSTNMCPVHRMAVLKEVTYQLEKRIPVICVSTQLIEAGVDIDFRGVIRSISGLDSIAQAAGRCNRNGLMASPGKVHVLNLQSENTSSLPDIKIGKTITERILGEYHDDPTLFGDGLIGLEAIERYYREYFFQREKEMVYRVDDKSAIGREDSLLSLLSANRISVGLYQSVAGKRKNIWLPQSFMSAAKEFDVIDSPTQGVIVPYETGNSIIGDISAAIDLTDFKKLLRSAQRYSVNLFNSKFQELRQLGAVYEIRQGSELYALLPEYYHECFGFDVSTTGSPGAIIC